jgi:YD repeat-containing protein
MKISFPCLFVATAMQFGATAMCHAQTIGKLLPPPAHIVIDGDTKEWGDSLRYYNTETHINYALANTKDTLYMAVRVNDRSEQARILKAGFTFSIDTRGKKKETFSITFPVNVNGSASVPEVKTEDAAPGDITQQDRDALMQEKLTTLRGIKVTGFKDIEDDMITTSNTYGFQTAVNYDQNGNLVCEAAIPISFFHAEDIAKNEWAFNFKINGLQRKLNTSGTDQQSSSGSHGGRGGGGGGGMGGGGRHGNKSGNSEAFSSEGHDALYKTEDFWEKFYLAK